MNDYEYVVKQLNLLIGFLDVSSQEVFAQIRDHDSLNDGLTVGMLYKNEYENYSRHICNAAVLLGFAHVEDFLGKCIRHILLVKPDVNKYRFDYAKYKENAENLVDFIAESQVRSMKVSDMLKFLKVNIQQITDEMHNNMLFFTDLRNCLVHKNGIADDRLNSNGFTSGQEIILNSGMINGYGLNVREYVKVLWDNLPKS